MKKTMGGDNCCALTGAKIREWRSPNAACPDGRLHWATIVAHSVRWPLRGPSTNFIVVFNKYSIPFRKGKNPFRRL